MNWPNIRNQKGSALLVTLTLLGLVFLVGVISVNNSISETDLSFNKIKADDAYYIAQAGARQAHTELRADFMWRDGFGDVSFNGGSFSVRVIDSSTNVALDDSVVIYSVGVVDGGRTEVELWTAPAVTYPFGFAMFAESGIAFDRETCTDSYDSDSGSYASTRLDSLGDVGTNGTITSSKDVNFGGGLQTATPGGITLGAFNTISGDTTSTADSVQLDIVPDSEYDWAKANSIAGTGLTGTNFTYNGGTRDLVMGSSGTATLTSGVYFFDDITLGQDSKIELAPGAQVTIYVTGQIHFAQNSTFNTLGSPSQALIYSAGDLLQFDQGNTFHGAFYGPGAHIQYDQTTEVYGSLVGGTIKLDKSACFHYDRALGNVQRKDISDMVAVAYREL